MWRVVEALHIAETPSAADLALLAAAAAPAVAAPSAAAEGWVTPQPPSIPARPFSIPDSASSSSSARLFALSDQAHTQAVASAKEVEDMEGGLVGVWARQSSAARAHRQALQAAREVVVPASRLNFPQ